MQIFNEQPVGERIKALLITLFSGVVAAIFLTLGSLYYYAPTGSYSVETILFPPTTAQKSFVFDHIEFLYLQDAGGWNRVEIGKEDYRKFYELVAKDKSLIIVNSQIEDLFRSHVATLTLTLKRTDTQKTEESKKLQEVQFVPSEDYYRIQSIEQGAPIWAYFHHPGIYKEVLNIFKTDE